MTTGWINEATTWWTRVTECETYPVPELTAQQLSEGLDRDVVSCRLWKANLRNRIYRVTFSDGIEAVAKQACLGEGQALENEFESLQALSRLELGEMAEIPAPIAYLRKQRTYLIPFIQGVPVDILIRKGQRRELLEACQLAGRSLARIHTNWTREIREIPVDDLIDDLQQLAVRLSRREEAVLSAAVDDLRGHATLIGQPFLDYKPANLIYDNNRIFLIDAPEEQRQSEILLWDVAVFGRGLRHEISKSVRRRSIGNVVRDAFHKFEQAYRETQPLALPLDKFRLLANVLELQRLGQLIALQRGKSRNACRGRLSRNSGPLRYLRAARSFAPLPLLRLQAHRLIAQLAVRPTSS